MFNVVFDTDISAEVLNQDLGAVQDWAYQRKMSFNPDPAKQAEQVIFSTKASKVEHPAIYFCGSQVETVPHHKHIGLILDEILNLAEHIKEATIKARRAIGIIRFLSKYVHFDVLDQMYKLYVRPHLDYGDAISHNQNSSLMSKLESTQYAAALAVSDAWRRTNTDKLLEELGWESLARMRLKNEQVQTDTRTVFIRIVLRLGTTLTQPFGLFLIFLSLRRHCNSQYGQKRGISLE